MDDATRHLANDARAYLATANDESARALATSVAWLGAKLLEDQEGWSHYWWIDDLLPDRIEAISQQRIEISGVLVWGDEKHQWIDPVHVLLSTTGDADFSFHLRFGDGSMGLGRVAYGERRPREWGNIEVWVFAFSGDSATSRPSTSKRAGG